MRSTSRKGRTEIQSGNVTKRMKRAETVAITSPIKIPEAQIKLRKELNDMAMLKYHISQSKMDKEYRMTSTILGSGSYAIVKLGEKIK